MSTYVLKGRRIGQNNHNYVHGMSRSIEYQIWCAMKSRCFVPTDPHYYAYGNRGITVCAQWAESFSAFIAYVGRRPSKLHSIDRIDNNGNYEPGNVRWATRTEQSRNKRNTKFISAFGENRPLAEWAEIIGIRYSILEKRLRAGWPAEKAVTTAPITNHNKRIL